jgi:serine/threonine protein kinase/tetratricopeptide (TPR) repeat protein
VAGLTGRSLGRYRLEATLGRGGMAEVYRATDTKLGRTVAVKVINPAHASDTQFLERFLREARLVASLEHPSILPIYDFGEEGGLPFLVMPYLPGGTLRERVGKPFPLPLAASYVRQLADALDAAHAAQILHRDVKPANVLLGKGDRLALADFGIAKMVESVTGLTATGMVVGTPIYMAPEQAQGRPASPATDRYALGVVAYELLAGTPPFEGESALALMHQHVTMPAPALSSRVGGLPPELDLVFERALAKDPSARPPTCRAIADALAAHLPSGAQPISGGTPWVRSHEEDATAPTRVAGRTLPGTDSEAGSAPTVVTTPRPGARDDASAPRLTSEATAISRGPRSLTRIRVPLALAAVLAGVAIVLLARRQERPAPPASTAPSPAPVAGAPSPAPSPAGAAEPTIPADVLVVEMPRPTPVPKPTKPVPTARAEKPTPAAGRAVAREGPAAEHGAASTPLAAARAAAPESRGVPLPPAPPPLSERPLLGLAGARARIDPFRGGGAHVTAADYEAALAEAQRVLAAAPFREDARFVAAYARGGVDYLARRDEAAKTALKDALASAKRMPFARDGRQLIGLLKRSEEHGGLAAWDVALAYGDARGEAEALLAAQLARSPDDPLALFGRAMLRKMQGRDEEAAADALRAEKTASGTRGSASIAEFLGETYARLGRYEEAVRWLRAAMDAPNAARQERAWAAYRAGRITRDSLRRNAEAAELFRVSCQAGNPEACLESGGEASPRGRLRRRFGR